MSRAYGYGLMNQKLNTLQSLVLSSPTTTPTLQQVLTADNTASLNVNIQDVNNSTVLRPTGLEISDAIGGILKLNTIDSNIIQINRDESSTTGDVYSAQYREYGTALNTTTTASGTFATSYAYDQLNLNKVIGATTTDLTVTSNQITSNDTLGITANTLNLNGQTVFDVPPHCAIDPTTGIDLANKGYVDSLVGQYSGGYNLYFNYSVTDPTYPTFQSLGQTVVAAAQQTVITNITSGTQEVARFITLPIGITTIPIGLWDALVYGAVSGIGGDVHYYFELYKKDALNVDTLLVTSGISPDVNASPSTNPTSYTMNATITAPITLNLTDRLFMILYVTKTGMNNINITTYFQNDYYSFTQSTLNAGTTLLSSNNTWTGTNKFDLAVSADSIQTNAIGNTANLFTTQTTGDFNLLTSKTTGTANILTGLARSGTTNIQTGSNSLNQINIGSAFSSTFIDGIVEVGTLTTEGLKTANVVDNVDLFIANTTGSVNILTGGSRGGTTNILTASGTANTLNIGSGNLTTQFNGLLYSGNLDQIGNLNVGTSSATTLTIGRTGNTATNLRGASVAISGNTAVTGSISATTSVTGASLVCPSIASAAVGTAISLYTANTTGQCDILTSTSRSGTTNIQTAGTGANAINIGSATSTTTIKGILKNNEITTEAVSDNMAVCNGLSKSGTLSIQAASTVANTIEIGSATSTTSIKGLRVTNIDSIASGAMSIGATNTTSINLNNRAVSGLTMGTNQFVTLGSANTALPAVNQIGYIYTIASPNGTGFVDNTALTTGVAQQYGSIASIPTGIYMVSANMNMAQAVGTTITSVIATLTSTGSSAYIDRKAFSNGSSVVNNYSISGIFSRSAAMTMTCTLTVSFTGTAPTMSIDSFKFVIVRIA
jgi:hypothetical protein|nr:MAG: hypothetical protein [Lake Baikal virophage 15]